MPASLERACVPREHRPVRRDGACARLSVVQVTRAIMSCPFLLPRIAMSNPLTAGSLCTRIVNVVERDMPLSTAARLMRERHVGCLVVVDRSERGETVAGILTDRDIVVTAVAHDLDARKIPVSEVMTSDPVTVHEDESMLEGLSLMRARGLRRVKTICEGVPAGLRNSTPNSARPPA